MTQHPHIKKHTGKATAVGLTALIGLGGLAGCDTSSDTYDSTVAYEQEKPTTTYTVTSTPKQEEPTPTYVVTGTPISIGSNDGRSAQTRTGIISIIIDSPDGEVLMSITELDRVQYTELEAIIKAMIDEKIEGDITITQGKKKTKVLYDSTLEVPSIGYTAKTYTVEAKQLGPKSEYTQ